MTFSYPFIATMGGAGPAGHFNQLSTKYAGVAQSTASTQTLKWSHRVDGIAEQRDIGGLPRLNRNRRENWNCRYTFLIGSSYQTSQYWMPVVRHLLRRDAHPPRF